MMTRENSFGDKKWNTDIVLTCQDTARAWSGDLKISSPGKVSPCYQNFGFL